MSKKYKVCIDPGHGVGEPNCSPDKSYYEYKFAWDLAHRVQSLLLWTGCFEVKFTKTSEDDTPSLSARASTANTWGADIFISIHSNAVGGSGWDDSVHGLTAWIYAMGSKRQELAQHLLDAFAVQGIELFGSKLYTAKFSVLSKTNMPAVLIEHYFHTCHNDVKKLLDNNERNKLAYAVACGVCEYFNLDKHLLPDEEAREEIYFTVQVGAFANEVNAEAMLARLNAAGIEGFVKEVKNRNL